MLQGRLTRDLRVVRSPSSSTKRPRTGTSPCDDANTPTVARMMALLDAEEPLAFSAVVPHGSTLKSISELLMRCAPHVPVTVDPEGLSFVACDPGTGRLIQVALRAADLLQHRFHREHPLRCTLESASLHAAQCSGSRSGTLTRSSTN